MQNDMSEDTYTIDITTASDSTFDIGTLTVDTVNIDSITGTTDYSIDWNNVQITTNKKRTDVRDNGKIPIDIWAKLYNNGVIEDDDELPF